MHYILVFLLLVLSSSFANGAYISTLLDHVSIGGKAEIEFLAPQGDNAFSFNNGNQGIWHTNEKQTRFRVDKLTLIPEAIIESDDNENKIRFYGELEARTNRSQVDQVFLREAHITFYLNHFLFRYFFLKLGIDDRFMSPEFTSQLNELKENKRLTEVYPINGVAFWEDEDLGITLGGKHPLDEKTMFHMEASLTNGLSLDQDEVTRNPIYPILNDDRDIQNINFDKSDNKEFGLGMGLDRTFSDRTWAGLFGFFFFSRLSSAEVQFLRDVIGNYSSPSKENYFMGTNGEFNIGDFNFFSQYIYSRDGHVTRHGYYFQPSFLFFSKPEKIFFRGIRFLYRFNMLDVKVKGQQDDKPSSPFTWDRETHSIAMQIHVHKYITWKNEFHYNDEKIGNRDDSQVSNNEFLSLLEFRF